nr:hypothetical protein BaRGS_008052 [Batillaria attramentaria]
MFLADVSDRGPVTSQQQHQQKGKEGLLPDANDMEVVYIKTEEEDDVFSIPLNPPAEEAAAELVRVL